MKIKTVAVMLFVLLLVGMYMLVGYVDGFDAFLVREGYVFKQDTFVDVFVVCLFFLFPMLLVTGWVALASLVGHELDVKKTMQKYKVSDKIARCILKGY